MSEERRHFQDPDGTHVAVSLPYAPERLIEGWSSLRPAMLKERPEDFSRDEWAYLMSFLSPDNLWRPFRESFGEPSESLEAEMLYRPRGRIALWLPNNVSLLGPLSLILLSLSGQEMDIKVGSHSADLSSAFLDFALSRLKPGPLTGHLKSSLHCAAFSREDRRNAQMAVDARVRVLFGGDAAAAAVEALPHPEHSVGFYFTDKRSEAWLEAAALSDDALTTLIKVFSIYGRAGCTSPRRAVILGAAPEQLTVLRERLNALWTLAWPRKPPMHVASDNLMARQWAAAAGWDAAITPGNAAVLALGEGLPEMDSLMFLPLQAADRESAFKRLPGNIQTVGYALAALPDAGWQEAVARSAIKRFVPLAEMHHFGPTWDGQAFWKGLFERIEGDA
jgi:hypothetical protein